MSNQTPFLSRSGLTGRWWLVTKYSMDTHGNKVATTKWDMNDAVRAIRADALRESADAVERLYAGTDGTERHQAWIAGVDAAARLIRERADREAEGGTS